MTEFEKILEYQRLNISLKKLDREFEKLDDKKKLDVVKRKYNALQTTVNQGEEEAETLIAEVNQAYADYKTLMIAFDELAAKINAAKTDEEKIKLLPQLESVKARIENADRKISQKWKRSKDIVSTSANAQESKKSVRTSYDEIKKRLDVYRAEIAPERKDIEDAMQQLEPQIDKELLSKYTKIRSDGILPVIVKAAGDEKNYSCYCGISLSQAKIGELAEKKLSQCENCRRMIYID